MLKDAKAAGVTGATTSGSTAFIYIGGVAGGCEGLGKIVNADVSGTVKMSVNATGSASYRYVCGGIIGHLRDGNMDSCDFTGSIEFPSSYAAASITYVGGLVGVTGGIFNNSASIVSNTSNNATMEVKDSNATGNLTLSNSSTGKVIIGGISGSINSLQV
jgi:hypothetical protein